MTDPDPIREYLFTPPAEMDGTPPEVGAKAQVQLEDTAAWFVGLIEETQQQIRNAWQTATLEEAPATSAADLAAQWESSDTRAGADRVLTLAAALLRAAEQMPEA